MNKKSFSKEDMKNIESCIRRRGTKSQREALRLWNNTLGNLIAHERYEQLLEPKNKIIMHLETKLDIFKEVLIQNNLYDEKLEKWELSMDKCLKDELNK